MDQICRTGTRLLNMLRTYWLITLTSLTVLSISATSITAQNPIEAIRELKNGTLVVRFPAFKNKIDTLDAMITRVTDEASMRRLLKLRQEAIQERDSVHRTYVRAFRTHYDFSDAAYFFDHEARNLSTAIYYNMKGEEIPTQDLRSKPVYYLVFERTADSKIDALVFYNAEMKKVPQPFPNNFTRGGFNFLFIGFSEKSFPDWRVKKINKKLHRFWSEVN